MERRSFLHLGLGAATVAAASTSAWGNSIASERIPLWPQGAPEQVPVGLRESLSERSRRGDVQDRALTGVSAPWLERFQPTQPNGAAIIAIPGGGYRHMAWDKEGLEIAQWFAARGVTGFALAYRLPHDGWKGGADTPLADAQRAVRLIRARASVWGLDPARIAVVGFSAGGHLAANLAALFDRRIQPMRDAIDRVSARPDLVAPVYPAIMIKELNASLPAGQSLFGAAADEEVQRLHSPHLNVANDAPPHFLVHAEDDPLVGPEHSLALRAALRARKISVETHLYARGGHGFGIRNAADLPLRNWPERLLAFGKTTGWIPA